MKMILVSAFLLAMAPLAAQAGETRSANNYTFVEGGYQYVDGKGADADGVYGRGSYNFDNSNVYVFGQAQRLDVRHSRANVNNYDVGVGYHHPLNQRLDLLGELAYVRQDASGGFDADGYRAGVGLKAALSPSWEGLAQVNYRDGHDFRGDWSGAVGLRYAINDRWSVNGQAEFFNDRTYDSQAYQVGVRYSF